MAEEDPEAGSSKWVSKTRTADGRSAPSVPSSLACRPCTSKTFNLAAVGVVARLNLPANLLSSRLHLHLNHACKYDIDRHLILLRPSTRPHRPPRNGTSSLCTLRPNLRARPRERSGAGPPASDPNKLKPVQRGPRWSTVNVTAILASRLTRTAHAHGSRLTEAACGYIHTFELSGSSFTPSINRAEPVFHLSIVMTTPPGSAGRADGRIAIARRHGASAAGELVPIDGIWRWPWPWTREATRRVTGSAARGPELLPRALSMSEASYARVVATRSGSSALTSTSTVVLTGSWESSESQIGEGEVQRMRIRTRMRGNRQTLRLRHG